MKKIENFNRNNILDLSGDEQDITGLWYGSLQAIRQTRKNQQGKYLWLCLCNCLKTCERTVGQLKSINCPSCVCRGLEVRCKEPEWVSEDVSDRGPPWLTKGQMILLRLIVPGPIGQGMTITAAAKLLKIKPDTAYKRLRRFRDRFPRGWDKVLRMRETMEHHRTGLRYPHEGEEEGIRSFEKLTTQHGHDVVESMVVNQF